MTHNKSVSLDNLGLCFANWEPHCRLVGLNGFNIFHLVLSSLTLENGYDRVKIFIYHVIDQLLESPFVSHVTENVLKIEGKGKMVAEVSSSMMIRNIPNNYTKIC